MENTSMIKALWVDDEYEKGTAFMDSADFEGIDIDPVSCVEDAIEKLKDSSVSYDAIILDANCKITNNPNELASLDALCDAVGRLTRMNTDLPWFVYTAANYEGSEHLRAIIKTGGKREYDDREYYVKPTEYSVLFENIKKAVSNMPTFIVKKKYAEALKVYSGEDIVQLLVRLENGKTSNAVDIPNEVRGVLDWVMAHLNEIGMLPVLFTKSNLNDCSRCLGSMDNDIIPVYIKCCFEHCVRVSNEGSHHELPTYQLLSKGKAPYLNESLIVDLLNILHWCGTIEGSTEDLKRKTIASYTSKKNNRNIQCYGRVISDNGVLKLGDSVLSAIDPKRTCKEGYMYAYIHAPKENKFIPLAYI